MGKNVLRGSVPSVRDSIDNVFLQRVAVSRKYPFSAEGAIQDKLGLRYGPRTALRLPSRLSCIAPFGARAPEHLFTALNTNSHKRDSGLGCRALRQPAGSLQQRDKPGIIR